MPRIRRRAHRQRQRLTVTMAYALVSGCDFFNEWHAPGQARETGYPAMQICWEDVGTDLLACHIRCHPGSRPWSWWQFDAPERRRRIDGGLHPHDRPDFPPQHKRLDSGRPAALVSEDCFEACYETQRAYLTRLRLLTSAERRILQYPDWQSEEEEETLAPMEPHLSLDEIRQWMAERGTPA